MLCLGLVVAQGLRDVVGTLARCDELDEAGNLLFYALEACPTIVELRIHLARKFAQVLSDALAHVADGSRRPEAIVQCSKDTAARHVLPKSQAVRAGAALLLIRTPIVPGARARVDGH